MDPAGLRSVLRGFLHRETISRMTIELERLGLVRRDGGGKGRRVRYYPAEGDHET